MVLYLRHLQEEIRAVMVVENARYFRPRGQGEEACFDCTTLAVGYTHVT